MKTRVKIIRKELGFTQQEFADKLGVKRNTVGQWECGVNPLTEQTITSICREFNVNEVWLRTGEGEMFLELEEDEYSKAAALLSDDPLVKSCLIEYSHLDDDTKKLFKDFITKLYKRMEQME